MTSDDGLAARVRIGRGTAELLPDASSPLTEESAKALFGDGVSMTSDGELLLNERGGQALAEVLENCRIA